MSVPTPQQILQQIQNLLNQQPQFPQAAVPIPTPASVPTLPSPIQQQNNALATAIANALGQTRLSVNFLELFTTYIFLGIIEPHSVIVDVPLPPGYTFNLIFTPPLNQIIVVAESNDLPTEDGVVAYNIFNDNILVHTDPAMVASFYTQPLNFFRIGGLVPTKIKLVAQWTNNDPINTVTVYDWTKYGQMDKALFNKIIIRYSQVVTEEIARVVQ